MADVLQWLPALLALVGGVTIVVTIREGLKAMAKNLDDHRAESRASNNALTVKVDTIAEDVSGLKTKVAVLSDRSDRNDTARLRAVP